MSHSMCRGQRTIWRSQFSAWVIRFGSKCLSPLSHLAGPICILHIKCAGNFVRCFKCSGEWDAVCVSKWKGLGRSFFFLLKHAD